MKRDPAARPDATAARRLLSAACDGTEAAADQETTPANGAAETSPATGSPNAAASAQPPAGAQPAGQPVAGQPVAGQAAWARPATPAVTPVVGPRRPGRHRRGLLLGGGGAAAR
jgi:hypothetical protein